MPFGHAGHSGQVRPNPAAEMYPPTNMSEYSITRDARARYFRIKLLASTMNVPCIPCNACPGTVQM